MIVEVALEDVPTKNRYGADFSQALAEVLDRGLPTRKERPGAGVRIRNALFNAGIFTLAELLETDRSFWLKRKAFGHASVTILEHALGVSGLALKGVERKVGAFLAAMADAELQRLFEAVEHEVMRRAGLKP